MRPTAVCSLLLAGLLVLSPTSSPAQSSDGGGSDAAVVLIPHGGAYLPGVSGLGDVTAGVDSLLGGSEMTFVAGATLQFGSPDGPANFRLSAVSTTEAVVTRETLPTEGASTQDFLAVTGDLVLRPIPRFLIQPYIVGGAGGHRSSPWTSGSGEGDASDSWRLVGKVGGGVDLRLGTRGVVISAEVVDYLSDFGGEGDLSHDGMALVGLGIPMF